MEPFGSKTPGGGGLLKNIGVGGHLTNGVPGVRLVGLGGREPVAEGDGEGVDRGLPSLCLPDPALPVGSSDRVGQAKALQR